MERISVWQPPRNNGEKTTIVINRLEDGAVFVRNGKRGWWQMPKSGGDYVRANKKDSQWCNNVVKKEN